MRPRLRRSAAESGGFLSEAASNLRGGCDAERGGGAGAFESGDVEQSGARAGRGAEVIGDTYAEVLRLRKSVRGIDRVAAPGEPLPNGSLIVRSFSLPRVLRTSIGTIPADVPYIDIDASSWGERLRGDK